MLLYINFIFNITRLSRHSTCGCKFSSNSRSLFRKPASSKQWRLLAHLLIHIRLGQRDIYFCFSINRCRYVLFNLRSWARWQINLHDEVLIFHGAKSVDHGWMSIAWLSSYPRAEARGRKPLVFTSRSRGGYTCSVVTSSSRLDSGRIDD
jgi:hypothetical protein